MTPSALLLTAGLAAAATVMALPSSAVEYSADYVMETAEGAFKGRLYVAPNKERREVGTGGDAAITVTRRDRNLMYTLMPADRIYAEAKLDAADGAGGDDRAMLKFAHAAPQDLKVFKKAFAFFNGGRPGGRSEAHLKEVRKIAAANGERELAGEDKTFSPVRDTQEELTRARDWLLYVDGGEKQVFERAVRRGDALARDDAAGPLERALAYYRFARHAAKEKALRDRAARLGEQHAAKGDSALAVRYFELAGQKGKAAQLAGDVKAQEKKAETRRRQAFDKDTKSLEKDLGL
jgi:hypothetical protein